MPGNSFKVKIARSRRKTMALHVLPDTTVLVKAPFLTPNFFINKFINDNSKWIMDKIEKVRRVKINTDNKFANGGVFYLLGNEYKLKFGAYDNLIQESGFLLFPNVLKFRLKNELEIWYRRNAREIITRQVEFYAAQMKAKFTDLTFSDTKSQWGRCTQDNKLQFSWRLVMAPLLVVNYVVVHELAHTFEKNHSRTFWNKVRYFNPSYRQQIKWLKENGDSLKLII